jgi:putative addiction module component (TIGR02574 family)
MMSGPEPIFDAALALSEEQRVALVELLLDSLSDRGADHEEEELVAELDRRRADGGTTIPWQQLRDEE